MNKKLLESHKVQTELENLRISDYNTGSFIIINSKTAFKKHLKKSLVYLNGERAFSSDYIKNNDIIEIYLDESTNNKPIIDLGLEIIYEDDYLAVVNKPAGIIVSGNKHWTIQNALPNNLKNSSQKDALKRPEPIHRLDYPTSGALLIGKTSKAIMLLNEMFKEKKIKKKYHAVTIGKMKETGVISFKIDNKPSETIYEVLQSIPSPKYTFLNLVELNPLTGRKHQIRKHLAGIGHPIFGDLLYGKEGLVLKGKGLYLHASSLRFIHPFNQESIDMNIPLPNKFIHLFS